MNSPNIHQHREPNKRPQLLGVEYDRVTLAETMSRIEEACATRAPLRIVTVNMNFLTLARRLPHFSEALATSGLSVVDGRLLQWLTYLAGVPVKEQITGHDIFHCSVRLAQAKGLRLFLLGGEPGVADSLAKKLTREFPGITVQGTHHGRFTSDGDADNQAELSSRLKEARPDLLFVALGAPKQDVWLAKHQHELGIPVGVGVGCVFDVEIGRIARAPHWMQVCGLESFFQLLVAPKRYLKRYLWDDIPTLLLASRAAIGVRLSGTAVDR